MTYDLASWLQHHDPGASLSLDFEQAKGLHQEMQQLRQSADRLRKQNKKLRRRVERLKAGEPDLPEDEGADT